LRQKYAKNNTQQMKKNGFLRNVGLLRTNQARQLSADAAQLKKEDKKRFIDGL
jgi:hypothetical protein